MIRIDKIRKYTITAFMVMSLITVTACGSKKDTASNKVAANIEQSTETATVAKAKDMQMQVKDSAGNVVKVTGTAEKTGDGSFKVKEAAVAGTAKVVADNGQETEVSNENKETVTVDEIKDTTTEVVKNDTSDNKQESGGTDTGKNDNTTDVTKPAEGNNTGNTAETPAPDNKQDSTGNSSTSDATPSTPEHTHTWNPVTTTVHHEATGHYTDVVVGTRTVVDKEAWDEPVYEWQYTKTRCKGCGQIFDTGDEWDAHATYQEDVLDDWSHGSYEVIAEKVQVDTIHHEAETHEEDIKEKRWVEDTAAYDETVITGYTCSCGATK
ncbi:MAG: hypothetical protein ACLT94_02810 [Lachnospira eligens]